MKTRKLGVVAALALAAGCGGGSGAKLVTRIVSPTAKSPLRLSTGSGLAHAQSIGQATSDGLTHLEYFITGIELCESLTAMGSGFSNPSNCLTLLRRDPGAMYAYQPGSDYFGLAATARGDSDPTHFVDLVDATARAGLTQTTTLGAGDAHDYNYGIVTWVPLVKVQADVTLADGATTLHTHDDTSVTHVDNQEQLTAATALTDGPSDLSVVVHSNGGNYFRFQSPMHIDPADLSAGSELALDLVFNPEGIIKGFSGGTPGPAQLRDGSNNRIAVPFLSLTPIPHATDATVSREAYRLHLVSGAVHYDVRFDLYYLTADANRSIYGVETTTLFTADDTSEFVSDFPKIVYIEADSGAGELKFEINGAPGSDTPGPAVLRHFVRTPADAATAELDCSDPSTGGLQLTGCSAGSTLSISYDYLGTTTL